MPFKTRFGISRNFFLAVLAAFPLVGIAPAQQPASQPAVPHGGLNPDSFYGKESFQGVSVRDSLEAVKKIEDARRMERLQDWNKAADWYQEVIEKYGQYVVPSDVDAQHNIRQYTGIELPVQEQLAKWPKEGLDAYRNRFGTIAATMLEQARPDDRETLSRVMKLYFVSESGKQAGIRLMDLLLESGEFAEAARVGDRLLDWHPTLVVERPKVLFRTALAYHLSGDEKKATERSEQLKAKFAGAVGTLFGKDIVLSDSLDRLLKVTPPVSVATAVGSVRMNPGGDQSRSMISAAKGRPGARMGTVDYVPFPSPGNPNQPFRGRVRMQMADGSNGNGNGGDQSVGFGVMPVADAGELYFQDGSRVYAVSLQSGVPLPGWLQSYPNSNGTYEIKSYGNARADQHTLTLTDSSVLAVMGYSDRMANYYGSSAYGADRATRLVCLDRATGREKWSTKPNKISEENLRALDFSGSPLVVGDNVYVIGRGGKNPTSEDCYILCFDVNSGNYKWSCFIASSNSGYNQFTGQYGSNDSLSHLAYSSGRIYILTNLGAAAAIDAYSGTISWLNIYPRDVEQMNPNMNRFGQMGMRANNNTNAWEYNPVIVQDGRVFILPTDSKYILVYDAGSGAEVKRIETADLREAAIKDIAPGDPAVPEALLGVDGHQMFLTGGTSVFCIDWNDPKVKVLWHTGFPNRVVGRGFVTSDSVFVCTESGEITGKIGQGALHRIRRFNPQTGEISGLTVQSYPKGKDWDEGEGPGNVIVVGDQVVVAGANRVNIYADLALARKRLDDDVAAAPNDPEPYLRYAEVMFVAGQRPVAMEKLNLAVARLGGLATLRPGAEREHLFSDCLTFAAKLQKDLKSKSFTSEEMPAQIDLITPLYDLAAAAADGDTQQVNYRMSRAKFDRDFEQGDSKAAAVELYQEILSNQKLRAVPLTDETQGLLAAADVAEKMIGEVKKEKPKAYEKFEKQATEAMQAAGADPALLKSVADTYPNSSAAPQAMTRAAAAFEDQNNFEGHRLAALTLQKVCNKYGDSSDMKKILEAMARNYLAMPETSITDRAGTANARLSKIVKLGGANDKLTKPLKLPNNKVLADAGATINEALTAVQHYKSEVVSAKLPDFHIMSITKYQKAIVEWQEAGMDPDKQPRRVEPYTPSDEQSGLTDVTALVKPPLDIRQQCSRFDRIVTWNNGTLAIYAVGAKTPLGTSAELTGEPKNLAWLDNNASLLVWSDSEMVLLDGKSAAKKWKLSLKNLPKIDVLAGGAADENMTGEDEGNVQIINNGIQRIAIRRQIINGRIVNIAQGIAPPPPPGIAAPGGAEIITSVRPVDDKIIVATSAGQMVALHPVDGKLAWHTRLSASGGISRVVASDDFVVAKVDEQTTTQLVAVNTYDGQLVKRMSFSNDSGNAPVNFALAPDGTLVWIQPDRLCGKDLFDPRKEPNFEVIGGQVDAHGANVNVQMNGQGYAPIYAGATSPDQLLISEGRILVVNNGGRFVSVHSLENGSLLVYKQPNGLRPEARLQSTKGENATSVTDWGVGMQVVGSRLFISSRQNGPVCYNLDDFGLLWGGSLGGTTAPNVQFQEPFVGQDYFVVFDRPAASAKPGANAGNNLIRLLFYSRASVDGQSGKESGRLDYVPSIRDEAGITQVEGVEGGFYYLTGDKKLHFLKGAREAEPAHDAGKQ